MELQNATEPRFKKQKPKTKNQKTKKPKKKKKMEQDAQNAHMTTLKVWNGCLTGVEKNKSIGQKGYVLRSM